MPLKGCKPAGRPPDAGARRLLAASSRRLVQQQPEAAAQGADCSSASHSVVGSPAACMVRCNGLLTPQQGDTYTGEGGGPGVLLPLALHAAAAWRSPAPT